MKLVALVVLSLCTFLTACSYESKIDTEEQTQPITLLDLQLKEWQLSTIDGISNDIQSTIMLDGESKVKGNLACNQFFGNIELQDNKLRISKMGSTRKMCEPDVNEVEMIVSSTLGNWSDVKINDQNLTISNNQHTLVYKIK